jgi:hypothetical protein
MPFVILPTNSISGGYDITNSLRFNPSSSDYLSRTPSTSATDKKLYTLSVWLKKCNIGSYGYILDARGVSILNNTDNIYIHSNNNLEYQGATLGSAEIDLKTNRLFRDVSAWYHLVILHDSTQGTSSDRVKIYINGVQETSFSTATYPALNRESYFNGKDSSTLKLGASYVPSNFFNGYMSEYYFIDGQALTPSSFGETDEDTGIWKPKAYTGTYGTNGFYLQFKNSASLGTDSSGNGNTFTVNNLTSIDQTTDTPTNNFCTWNPLYVPDTARANTYSDGNLKAGIGVTGGYWITTFANFSPSQGKWYWEIKPKSLNTTLALGIYFGQYTTVGSYPFDANVFGCHQNGLIYYNGGTYSYMASYTSDDIVTFALDMDNKKFYMGKNGSWANGSGSTNQIFANAVSITDDVPVSFPTGKDVFPILTAQDAFGEANFGSPIYSANSYTDGAGYGNFSYAVPSGYYALCTKNLATFG